MTYDEIVSGIADSMGLPKTVVDRTYRAYWRAIREHITSLPLKQDLTEEEFSKLRPNINIPSIGKLYITFGRHEALRNKHKRIQELKNKKNVED